MFTIYVSIVPPDFDLYFSRVCGVVYISCIVIVLSGSQFSDFFLHLPLKLLRKEIF